MGKIDQGEIMTDEFLLKCDARPPHISLLDEGNQSAVRRAGKLPWERFPNRFCDK
jgi:hypothetical protein